MASGLDGVEYWGPQAFVMLVKWVVLIGIIRGDPFIKPIKKDFVKHYNGGSPHYMSYQNHFVGAYKWVTHLYGLSK